MDEITTLKELKERFAYQFCGETRFAFEWYRGWLPVAAQLCADVDALVRDDRFHRRFRWLQIKEKLGCARFYWEMRGLKRAPVVDVMTSAGHVQTFEPVPSPGPDGDRAAARQIRELVRAAEAQTRCTCITCGAPGKQRKSGWITVLCDAHHAMREKDPKGLWDLGFTPEERAEPPGLGNTV